VDCEEDDEDGADEMEPEAEESEEESGEPDDDEVLSDEEAGIPKPTYVKLAHVRCAICRDDSSD
jgi:hypothetical protein